MKTYTDLMRELRQDKDLKQITVANVLGTSQQHYSKYETGEYELPLRALIALADYYDISTDFLTGRTRCKEGVEALNKKVTTEQTVGEVLTDLLSLDPAGREFIIECIYLQKLKKACHNKEKDGSRL